jgi:hypothetical protein
MSETTQTQQTFKLTDDVISYVAKNLQLCILTGTDIVDHLRMMELTTNSEGKLVPTDNYIQVFDNNQKVLLARAEELAVQLQAQQEGTENGTSETPASEGSSFTL